MKFRSFGRLLLVASSLVFLLIGFGAKVHAADADDDWDGYSDIPPGVTLYVQNALSFSDTGPNDYTISGTLIILTSAFLCALCG